MLLLISKYDTSSLSMIYILQRFLFSLSSYTLYCQFPMFLCVCVCVCVCVCELFYKYIYSIYRARARIIFTSIPSRLSIHLLYGQIFNGLSYICIKLLYKLQYILLMLCWCLIFLRDHLTIQIILLFFRINPSGHALICVFSFLHTSIKLLSSTIITYVHVFSIKILLHVDADLIYECDINVRVRKYQAYVNSIRFNILKIRRFPYVSSEHKKPWNSNYFRHYLNWAKLRLFR